jgi:hypothetical protein
MGVFGIAENSTAHGLQQLLVLTCLTLAGGSALAVRGKTIWTPDAIAKLRHSTRNKAHYLRYIY